MNCSNGRASKTLHARRRASKSAGLMSLGALALVLTAGIPAHPAQAQFLRWWWWHRDEGPPPIPPGYVGRHHETWRDVQPTARHPVSVAEMRHKASGFGLRLLGTPHRQGRVFVGFGEDPRGVVHHLVFDAYEGTLIANETTSVKAKAPKAAEHPNSAPVESRKSTPVESRKVAAPPQAPAPATATAKAPAPAPAPAAAHPAAMTASAAAPAPQAPPTPAPSSTDKDLSPIRPKPGPHTTTTPADK